MYLGIILGFLGILSHSCETDPVVWINGETKPVIFGTIDHWDSIHYLKIGRTFGALSDPYESSKIWDSIYPDTSGVQLIISRRSGSNPTIIKAEPVLDIPKELGIFLHPNQLIYRYHYNFSPTTYNMTVRIPGLEDAKTTISVITLDHINTPKYNQQYIYLIPDNPLRIQWDGNEWNEVDVTFEFLEKTADTTRRKKVHIQNTNFDLSPYPKYREMTITYEEFVKEVIAQIPVDPVVKKRYLSIISIEIYGGDSNMVNYIKYYNGFTDFNVGEYSNIQNGYGMIASRCSFVKDSMEFDYWTTEKILEEPRLRYLKLDPWH